MLVERAAASMFPTEGSGITDFAEQGRGYGIAETRLRHVAVAEGREGARLSATVWTDMEEAASGSHTTVEGFLVAWETQENHLLILFATFF